MVDVVALSSGRCHDRCIRDGRAVVSAHCACQTCCNGDDQQIAGEADADNNGKQDSEGSPGSTGGECQEDRHEEYNGRKHAGQPCCASFKDAADIFCRSQIAGQPGQGPCKGQDQNRADHGFEAFGKCFHTVLESEYFPDHIKDDRDQKRCRRTHGKAGGRVTVCERIHKVFPVKEAAGIDHADDTAGDQDDDRECQIDDFAFV